MNVDHEPQLPKNVRVRLRKTVDPKVYGDLACVGNEGWIRDHRADPFGYPEAYIEWDKNHWAYNGVGDGWTFEEHFELVDKMAAKKRKTPKDKEELLAAIASLFNDEDEEEEEKPQPKSKSAGKQRMTAERFKAAPEEDDETDGPSDEEYQTYVQATSDLLQEADGFIVIGMERHSHPAATEGMLVPFVRGISKTPEAEIMITSRMAVVAAQAHQELGIARILDMQEEE